MRLADSEEVGGRAQLFLVTVMAATVVYFLLSTDAQSLLYDLIGVAAAVVMLACARHHWPAPAWVLLGLGVLALAAGNIVFGTSEDVPSPADMFYISAYPLLALGIGGLMPGRTRLRDTPDVAIAAGVASIVGAASWIFLILPAGDTQGVTLASHLVAFGYPAMDLFLIGLLVRVAGPQLRDNTPHRLVGIALVLMVVADTSYALANSGDSYALGSAVDAAWLLSYGFFGAALLHSTARRQVADAFQSSYTSGKAIQVGTQAPTLRLTLIATWVGRILLGFAVVTMFLGAKMLTGEIILLSGAYAITGLMMMAAGSIPPAGTSTSTIAVRAVARTPG